MSFEQSSSLPAEVEASDKECELEEKLLPLQKEKTELERDFQLKQVKFQELFLQKEEELKLEHEKYLAAESKLASMEEELSYVRVEMDKVYLELEDVKTAAAVSEASRQEEISDIISKYQQEVASLQQLLRETKETAPISTTSAQPEPERNKLINLSVNYEEQIQGLRNKLSQEKASFLSAVAKSIKRVGSISLGSTNTEKENLEDSMKKAQEEAQILKSVVVPLENEIKDLKCKLEEAEEKLTHVHKLKGQLQDSSESGTVGSEGRASPYLPDLESITDPSEKVDKLYSYLKAEKAARKDLEMYVAVLSTRKSILQEEADKVSTELQDVCCLLEEEKQSHEALKETWQMANDQFLESQRLMMMDLRRMEGVLTTEQQRHVTDLRKKAANDVPVKVLFSVMELPEENSTPPIRRPASMPDMAGVRKQQQKDEIRQEQVKKIKELEEKRGKQEQEHEEKRTLKKTKIGKQKSRLQEGSSSDSPSTLQKSNQISSSVAATDGGIHSKRPSSSSAGARGTHHSASSSEIGDFIQEEFDDDSIFLDNGDIETQSLSEADSVLSESKDISENMTVVRISPEKVLSLPLLTAAQMKALTDPSPETDAYKSLVANIKSKSGTNTLNLKGKRLVSEKEWTLLEEEIRASREKLGEPCTMCSNYEVQLQTIQKELRFTKLEMKRSLNNEQESNKNLLKHQEELHMAFKEAAEDAQTQIIHLTNRLEDCEKCIKNYRKQMSITHLQLEDQCKSLAESRVEIQNELTKLQDENDSLMDKYSKTAQELQNDVINFPTNAQEMQVLLLKLREEVILAKVAQEHIEEKMKSEIVFLKSQVISEQQEKVTLEETMTQEITALQAKLAEMHSFKQELEQELLMKVEAETKLREAESSLKGSQFRYKQVLGKMQERLEELDKRKSKLESENHSLKGKVQVLQADLSNSEAVQRDFVKLSQSLQIQLEKIRQGENEVRWQHEDDINECSSCKMAFTVTRRKHHCRHCGQVFCADCTMKSVASGPNLRPSKVCDVCHTILVKDATPYFSTEAPET